MSTIKFRQIKSDAFVEVNITGDCPHCDDYVDLDNTFTIQEILKLAAEIIDSSSFYKEMFEERRF